MDILGGSLVIPLFFIYWLLWKIKKWILVKTSGIDPEVFKNSKSSLQRYLGAMLNLLTVYVILIIITHTANFQIYSLFARFELLDGSFFKFAGFGAGIIGLSVCLYAQIKMGQSWRVGIDENEKTVLVQSGIYKFIRNPTYLGLFVLNLGVWLIWPTWTVFIFNLLFIYTLEIQVRCEEDFLETVHGENFIQYKKHTKRYVPWIY